MTDSVHSYEGFEACRARLGMGLDIGLGFEAAGMDLMADQ